MITPKDRFRALGRFDPGTHQLRRNLERTLGGVGIVKGSRIGEQGGVDTLRDLFRHADAGRLAEVVDHLADRGSRRVDPVDGTEELGGGMVIDIDDELFFQIDQAGPVNVRALDDETRRPMLDLLPEYADSHQHREFLDKNAARIAHDDLDALSSARQQPKRPARNEAVAIGANVGSNRKRSLFSISSTTWLSIKSKDEGGRMKDES